MRMDGVLATVSEILLPSLCVTCGESLSGREEGLCDACWGRVVVAGLRRCPRCGGPGDPDLPCCLDCTDRPPPQLGTIVWASYEGVAREAILALKHRGRDDLARPLGDRIAELVASSAYPVAAVVPVPSHPLRRLRRGYVAAEEIARSVAARLEAPCARLLARRGLARQATRRRALRMALPRGSFRPRRKALDGPLLLVDDVTTTGATLRSAAAALKAAGATEVRCAVLAHTPQPWRVV